MTSARQPTFRRIHNSCTSNTSCVTRKEQQKSERASQQLCHGCRTLLDAGSPPTAQLPQIFGLPLRDEDLVQEHCLIHCLGGKFLRMLMPESTSNLRIALLNDGVANHGHLLFGLTFNDPGLSMTTAATQICCRSLTLLSARRGTSGWRSGTSAHGFSVNLVASTWGVPCVN